MNCYIWDDDRRCCALWLPIHYQWCSRLGNWVGNLWFHSHHFVTANFELLYLYALKHHQKVICMHDLQWFAHHYLHIFLDYFSITFCCHCFIWYYYFEVSLAIIADTSSNFYLCRTLYRWNKSWCSTWARVICIHYTSLPKCCFTCE